MEERIDEDGDRLWKPHQAIEGTDTTPHPALRHLSPILWPDTSLRKKGKHFPILPFPSPLKKRSSIEFALHIYILK